MRLPLLLSLHHLDVVRTYADRVVAIKGGRLFYDGPPSGLTPEVEAALYFGEGLEGGGRFGGKGQMGIAGVHGRYSWEFSF
mgnify:CR=1 FL=1